MAVAHFKDRKGDKGDQGEAGLSAFDIWLLLGNEGTEQDFIESLRGPAGKKGKDGKDGKDGVIYSRSVTVGGEGGSGDGSFDADKILTGPTECLYAGSIAPLDVLIDQNGNVLVTF